jgi:hypothetical protein
MINLHASNRFEDKDKDRWEAEPFFGSGGAAFPRLAGTRHRESSQLATSFQLDCEERSRASSVNDNYWKIINFVFCLRVTRCDLGQQRGAFGRSRRMIELGAELMISLIRVSNFTVPIMPTLRPKLRKMARRSFSMAMVFD